MVGDHFAVNAVNELSILTGYPRPTNTESITTESQLNV